MAAPKRCHYEVLELPRAATYDEIKAAYRRLALVHHPDKNGGTVESTERFRTIQTAYAVLTDDKERAWYDSHREDIIAGDSEDKADRVVNVYAFFSAECFSTFDDSPRGFYSVFADVFRRIAAEEARYAEPDAPPPAPPPSFGEENSPADFVLAFYSAWLAFTSRMTFSWADEYNPLEASSRIERRAIERENAKLRSAARRERTEGVRALVAYCQRRDKRYIRQLVEARRRADEEEERRKAVAAERQRAAAEARAALAREHAEEAEAREREVRASGAYRLADDDDDGSVRRRGGAARKRAALEAAREIPGLVVRVGVTSLGDDAVAGADEDGDDSVAVFVCEACNKTFRSAAAMANHEASKKHAQVMRSLGLAARPGPSAAVASSTPNAVSGAFDPSMSPALAQPPGDDDASDDEGVACAGDEGVAPERPGARSAIPLAADDRGVAKPLRGSGAGSVEDSSDSDADAALLAVGLRLGKATGGSVAVSFAAEQAAPPVRVAPLPSTNSGDSSSDDLGDVRGGAASKKAKKKDARAAARRAMLQGALAPSPTSVIATELRGTGDDAGSTVERGAEGEAAAEAAASSTGTKTARKARRAPKSERAPPPPTEGSVASLLAAAAAGSGGRPGRARADLKQPEAQPRRPLNIAGEGFAAESAACEVCGERFEARNALFAHIRASGHAALREDRGGGSSRAARKAAR